MSAPQLNRSLVLEAPLHLADGAGGFTPSWEALGVVWAEVRAATGRQAAGPAGTPQARARFRITLRAAPQGSTMRPAAGQRLRDGARIFAIEAVTDYGQDNRYLTCHTAEETAP